MTYIGRSTNYLVSNEAAINNIEAGGTYIDGGASDWVELPIVEAAKACIDNNELPLWDKYNAMGMPIIDNINGSTLSPFSLIMQAFGSSEVGLNFVYIIRLLWVMLFTYLFLTELGTNFWTSVVGGLAFGLCGYCILFMNIFFFNVDVFLPMLMWVTEKYYKEARLIYWGLVSVTSMFMILGGNPQNYITNSILAVSFYGYMVFTDKDVIKTNIVKFAKYIVALLGAMGMTLGYWLSFIGLYLNSYSYHDTTGEKVLTIKELLAMSLPIGIFDASNRARVMPYIGISILLIILIGITIKRSKYNREVIFFTLFSCAFALKLVGFPLVNWVGKLPILSSIIFIKYNCSLYFSLVCIMAIMLDNIRSNYLEINTGVSCILFAEILICVYYFYAIFESKSFLYEKYKLVLPIIMIICLCGILTSCIIKKAIYVICSILVILELISYPMVQNILRIDSDYAYKEPEFISCLKEKMTNEYDRVFTIGGLLMGNISAYYGLSSLNGISPTHEIHYWNFMNKFILDGNLDMQQVNTSSSKYYEESKKYLDMLSVKYILTDNDYEITQKGLTEIYNIDGVHIYENVESCEKAYLVHNVYYSNCEKQTFEIMEGIDDFKQEAVVETQADLKIEKSNGNDLVKVNEYNNNSITIYCNLNSKGLLVLSDLYYPGWEAYVDGELVDILRVNDVCRGIPIEKGKHEIIFIYRPKSLYIGGLISLCVLVIYILIFIFKRKVKNE